MNDSERSWDGDSASVASNKSDNDLLFNVSMQLGLFNVSMESNLILFANDVWWFLFNTCFVFRVFFESYVKLTGVTLYIDSPGLKEKLQNIHEIFEPPPDP